MRKPAEEVWWLTNQNVYTIMTWIRSKVWSFKNVSDHYTPAQGCFEFSQNDNPVELSGQAEPAGFVLESAPEDFSALPRRLRGLSRSTPTKSFLDGDLAHEGYFFWSIGMLEIYTANPAIIPGPPFVSVAIVELYIRFWSLAHLILRHDGLLENFVWRVVFDNSKFPPFNKLVATLWLFYASFKVLLVNS